MRYLRYCISVFFDVSILPLIDAPFRLLEPNYSSANQSKYNKKKLTEELMDDEGLCLRPYRDTEGKLTIGVGRNLERGGGGISEEEADYLIENDINAYIFSSFNTVI